MRTNKAVIENVKKWMESNNKSHQWLAEELNVSKSLIGHMLSGNRTIPPQRIVLLANLMNMSIEEITQGVNPQTEPLTVQLRGNLSNRRSKQELQELLFEIEDYIGLMK